MGYSHTDEPLTTLMKDEHMFEPGKTYTTRSTCNHDCVIAVRIISRTAKSVVMVELINGKPHDEPKRKKIYTDQGREYIMPWGQFSMAPCLYAERS